MNNMDVSDAESTVRYSLYIFLILNDKGQYTPYVQCCATQNIHMIAAAGGRRQHAMIRNVQTRLGVCTTAGNPLSAIPISTKRPTKVVA